MTNNIPLRTFLLGKPVLALDSCNTVKDALDLMDRHNCPAVGVTVNGYFAGIFTDNNFFKRV